MLQRFIGLPTKPWTAVKFIDGPIEGEGGMKSTVKLMFFLYGVLGLITIFSQISNRYIACAGALGCGLSFAKGIVWSALWPVYWAIQWNWLKF
jgi:hypothetical protein